MDNKQSALKTILEGQINSVASKCLKRKPPIGGLSDHDIVL